VKTRNVSPVVLSLLLAGLAACSQFAVRTKRDPNVDFARFHTFAWLPLNDADPADQRVLDRAIDARIRARVDAELREKGFTPAGNGAPDVFLNYRLSSNPDSDMRGRSFNGTWWAGWPGEEGWYTESYDVGTLYVAAADPRTKRMVWVGAAEARLLPHVSLETRLKRVDAAVHRILVDFPAR